LLPKGIFGKQQASNAEILGAKHVAVLATHAVARIGRKTWSQPAKTAPAAFLDSANDYRTLDDQ
jgi:hypothetical protein